MPPSKSEPIPADFAIIECHPKHAMSLLMEEYAGRILKHWNICPIGVVKYSHWDGDTMRSRLWKEVQATLLKPWIKRIRALKIWNWHAQVAYIDVTPQEPWTGAGLCHREAGGPAVVTVYATGDLIEDVSCILHELAHAQRGWYDIIRHHSAAWAKVYRDATEELTGVWCELDAYERNWTGNEPPGWIQDDYVVTCLKKFFKRTSSLASPG